jgi:hypothetical protein
MSDQHPIWGSKQPPPSGTAPQPRPQPPQPPQGPPPPEPWRPPPESLISAIVGLVVLIVIVLVAHGQAGSSGGSSGTPHQIRYEVTGYVPGLDASFDGTVRADMTFQDQSGDTAQQSDQIAPIPWSYTLTATPGDFLYVSAQLEADAGTITCTIYLDGQVVKQSTSEGAYTICQASGKL